jgi:hydroxypyruvate isomerase
MIVTHAFSGASHRDFGDGCPCCSHTIALTPHSPRHQRGLPMTDRRTFLSGALQAGAITAIAATSTPSSADAAAREKQSGARRFKRMYAPHFGMFEQHAGADLVAQLEFMAAQGFTAFEDNGLMARTVDVQERIGTTLARLGMTMGVFVIDGGDNWKPSLTTGDAAFRDNFLRTCRDAVEVAKRVNARWATVVPGFFDRRVPLGIQTGRVIDTLRAGAKILEPHGLTMVLEPLSDTPELFLRNSDQAFALCRAVDSPACKILYDMYHMQRNQGDIMAHADLAWGEIAYFQIGDNPGRKEPGSGEMNYHNIFRHIHEKGYAGVFGMEHGASQPGKAGEQGIIDAYLAADSF